MMHAHVPLNEWICERNDSESAVCQSTGAIAGYVLKDEISGKELGRKQSSKVGEADAAFELSEDVHEVTGGKARALVVPNRL